MNSNPPLYRLADHVVVEPLIDQWIAWPHNFSPILYGFHFLNYQKAVLTSYIKNPAIHVKSSGNPKLLGGPFVNVPQERVEEIARLLETMERQHGDLVTLAQDLTAFQIKLKQEAKGQSLEAYYQQLPDSLQGFVELGYDYLNNPVVRCIESLFYESAYYKKDTQSFRIFALTHDDDRSYYMSTPRLSGHDAVEWRMPFDAAAVDTFYRLDTDPRPLSEISAMLALQDESTLLPLLSDEPLTPAQPWSGDGVRLRYFGHATVLIEAEGTTILTDPFISVSPEAADRDRFTFRDLPARIDYVLITHGHHDHFVFESLLRLRHRIGTLVVPRNTGVYYGDLSLKQLALRLGFKQVVEMDALDSISLAGGRMTAIPFLGEHCDLLHAKLGYVVRFGDEQILFAADSCCLDKYLYANIRKTLGPITTAFIGMECIGAPLSWIYSPLLPVKSEREHDQSRRSHANGADSALELLQTVGANTAYVYALGREPWLKYFMALEPTDDDPYMVEIRKFVAAAQTHGIDAQMLYGKQDLFCGDKAHLRCVKEQGADYEYN